MKFFRVEPHKHTFEITLFSPSFSSLCMDTKLLEIVLKSAKYLYTYVFHNLVFIFRVPSTFWIYKSVSVCNIRELLDHVLRAVFGTITPTTYYYPATKDNDDQDDDEFTLWRETLFCCCVTYVIISVVEVKWIPMPKPSMPLSMSWNVTTSCADGYYSLIRKKIQTTIPKGLANPIFMYH